MKLLCKWFGHKYSQMALIIAEIKGNDLNKGKPNILACTRCGDRLDMNDMEELERRYPTK